MKSSQWSRLKAFLDEAIHELKNFDRTVAIESLIMTIFGILNNVSTSMMQFSFQGYPSFTNYFAAIVSCAILVLLSLYKKEQVLSGISLTWLAQKQYLILGLITVVTYGSWTYAGAWVDGNLQQVLSNLTFVFVFIFSVPILGLKISKREAFASLIIVLGVLVGMIPALEGIITGTDDDGGDDGDDATDLRPPWFNSWYFICLFILAVLFQALGFVYQDRALRPP